MPEIERFTFKDDIVIGKRVTVTCVVSQQTDPVSFKWLKNDKEIEVSNNVRIKGDQEFSMLIIDPANLDDEGNYTCIASNVYGSTRHTAHLSIKGELKYIFTRVQINTQITS